MDGESRGVAVAVDGEVVRRAEWGKTKLRSDQSGGGGACGPGWIARRHGRASSASGRSALDAASATPSAAFELGGRTWGSRLIVGTGGFRSLEAMERALVASGAEIVTVALRRVDPLAGGRRSR